jgi:uncharacterized protein YdiU (UPF0061 family)
MPISPAFRPARSHADLGGEFFDVVEAARFPTHIIRHRDQRQATRLGLDGLTDEEWIAHFGRFEPLPGSFEAPLALRYHGHQFRHYNPDLGDGRGFLFAQMHDLEDGRLLDFGTKGSGQTPWSRTADGRLTLKGGVREVLATSLLEALGVNTSKSFSLIETGEDLQRNDEPSPTRSSVLVRLSHSHIRIGTFQRFAYLGDAASISALVAHAVQHYLPEAAATAEPERAARFFAEVCRRVARMGAQWMAAGFVHGVLNTDNINITGESFDYGPWRFLPTYDPKFTAAYFDYGGLYAFGRQPETLLWNLARLGGCLLPLAGETDLKARLEESLHGFGALVQAEFARAVLWRLGLKPVEPERDAALSGLFFTALLESEAPFERAFFDWRGGRVRDYPHAAWGPVRAALAGYERAAAAHPYFEGAGPATLLIEEVEALWAPIAESDDWGAFHAKLAAIEQARLAHLG